MRLRRCAPGLLCLPIALAGACLLAPNPDFMGPVETEGFASEAGTGNDDADSDGSSDGCPTGTLDCDGEPGCEAAADDPLTCGSCTHDCGMPDLAPTCTAGRCLATVELDIVDDAHLDADQPAQNFGAAPTLVLDPTHQVLIGLPNLFGLPGSAEFESITVLLDASTAGAPIEVYRVEGPWDEDSVTEASAPAIDGDVLVSWTPALGTNQVELVGLLGAWQLGSPAHSIGLVPTADGDDPSTTVFHSSEGLIPPTLVVTLGW